MGFRIRLRLAATAIRLLVVAAIVTTSRTALAGEFEQPRVLETAPRGVLERAEIALLIGRWLTRLRYGDAYEKEAKLAIEHRDDPPHWYITAITLKNANGEVIWRDGFKLGELHAEILGPTIVPGCPYDDRFLAELSVALLQGPFARDGRDWDKSFPMETQKPMRVVRLPDHLVVIAKLVSHERGRVAELWYAKRDCALLGVAFRPNASRR